MTTPRVSLVVVSRDRPDALARCLTAVLQLWYRPLEIIVVSDPSGMDCLAQQDLPKEIKLLSFEEQNISRARNAGIAVASGEIIAFLDDDAVPEPSWLNHLVAAFADPDVAIAGGFVKGRNGISWQWQGRTVDARGHMHALDLDPSRPAKVAQKPGLALKTEGTNMAVRAQVLRDIGGFDPSFQYFLDETDLNLRFAASGFAAAVVPRAVVHHGFARNMTRRTDRAPRDLFQIGASWAVFLAKHCPEDLIAIRWQEIRDLERRRLLGYMLDGRLDPWGVNRVLATMDSGFSDGHTRPVRPALPPIQAPEEPFHGLAPIMTGASDHVAGRIWNRRHLIDRCRAKVAAGKVATMMIFSPTTFFHSVRFTEHGFWEHRGGLYGKSLRSDRIWRFWRFRSRVRREWSLVSERHAMTNSQ